MFDSNYGKSEATAQQSEAENLADIDRIIKNALALSQADRDAIETQEVLASLDRLLPDAEYVETDETETPVKAAQAKLDRAIDRVRTLKMELRAAIDAERLARRERDDAAAAARPIVNTKPSTPLMTLVREWLDKNYRDSDPDTKRMNATARQRRRRERINADPVQREQELERHREREARRRKRKHASR